MKWISVQNRLPAIDVPVLVTSLSPSQAGCSCEVMIAIYDDPNEYEFSEDGEGWLARHIRREDRHIFVTHWAELPQPADIGNASEYRDKLNFINYGSVSL